MSLISGLLILLLLTTAGVSFAPPLSRIKVNDDQRLLITESGEPFFWLGDTAWELFHRLSREEANVYLEDRAKKGFTVIQAVALAEMDDLTGKNFYGHSPLRDQDPTRPDVKEVEREFTPPNPGEAEDWVLVLDDATKDYSTPGAQQFNK